MSTQPLRRADYQAARRLSRRRSKSSGIPPRGKSKKRALIILGSIFGVIALLIAGVFVYARWRFDQIPKITIPGLTPRNNNKPFTILLVGSDSRTFVSNAQQSSQFGSASATTGQRSDVTIVARVVPALGEVKLMSIPRDTYVDIPGNVAGISGQNRINAAFNSGPNLLIKTIEDAFHIPINDYAEVNFPGFQGMVDAVGGIGLDFKYPVRDAYSQLNITTTGCQLVQGKQALALVRSRHLYYYENGAWQADYGSDWSRIQRQDAFFRALLPKLHTITTNPGALNGFIGSATKSVAIDATISESMIISLANSFGHISSADFSSETLPTVPYTTSGGADVLLPAPIPDEQMITQFLNFGSTSTTSTTKAAIGAHAAPIVLTAATTGSSGPTVTTIVGGANPADVVYNTAKEPWNPTPCMPKS
jgi:LCP family protein required for cell wall assembly